MRFRDLFRSTLATLWGHKLRTALTMFGIAWGIISITLMVAAGEGLRVGQAKVAAGFGKDLMIVFAGRTSLQAGGTAAGHRIFWRSDDWKPAMDQSPACRWILPELGQDLTVRSSKNSGQFTVEGSLPPFQEIRSIPISEGRFYTWEDEKETRRVAILGSEVREQLFGGNNPLGESISIGGYPFTVIGVMRSKDQDNDYDGQDVDKIFVPFSVVLRDYPNRPPAPASSVDRLLATPKSIAQHEECKFQLRHALGNIHGFDPRDEEAAGIWDTIEEAKAFELMTDGMKHFLGAVGFTTLLLGGLGVMNVMLVAVRERTREIGIRKAVGASSHSIILQFFTETLIVVFVSGGIGMAVARVICFLFNLLPQQPYFAGLIPTWGSSLLAFSLLGTIAILAALYPASRAAAVDPIEALRYEPGS